MSNLLAKSVSGENPCAPVMSLLIKTKLAETTAGINSPHFNTFILSLFTTEQKYASYTTWCYL